MDELGGTGPTMEAQTPPTRQAGVLGTGPLGEGQPAAAEEFAKAAGAQTEPAGEAPGIWPTGTPIPSPVQKFCYACGTSIDARAEICPKCGVRQPVLPGASGGFVSAGDVRTRSGKSKMAASLLAILLGSFGVHKFYLGEVGMGVLYAVFFWTLIPAIAGVIEGVIWLTQTDEVWLATYGDR